MPYLRVEDWPSQSVIVWGACSPIVARLGGIGPDYSLDRGGTSCVQDLPSIGSVCPPPQYTTIKRVPGHKVWSHSTMDVEPKVMGIKVIFVFAARRALAYPFRMRNRFQPRYVEPGIKKPPG